MLEPLGLEIIAASIPHHDVKLIDLRLEPHLEDEIRAFQPDIVGIHCLAFAHNSWVINTAREVKELDPGILTVVGGAPPTLMPKDFDNEFIDVIVIGDGQITFNDLVDCYQTGANLNGIAGIAYRKDGALIFNDSRALMSDLDETFPANRELTRKYSEQYFYLHNRPFAMTETSKGCPYKCSFCLVWKLNRGECRRFSPRRIVEDLCSIQAKHVFFADDNFLLDNKKDRELYEAVSASGVEKTYVCEARSDVIARNPDIIEKWRRIGLDSVEVGLEYVQDSKLEEVDKRNHVENNREAINVLHMNGVQVVGLFIVNPNFDASDFEKLLEYVEKSQIDFPIFSILTPFPGTKLYQERYKELLTHNYELYDGIHAVLPTKLPREEFYVRFAELYKKTWVPAMRRYMRQSDNDIEAELALNFVKIVKYLSNHRNYLALEVDEIGHGERPV
ncbi:MAG: B12-binding domain-containing radical SAM protein [Promethearchaeota archaeon]